MSTGSAGDSRDAIVGTRPSINQCLFFSRHRLAAFLEDFLSDGIPDWTLGRIVGCDAHQNLRRVDLEALTPDEAAKMLNDVENGGGPWG